MNPFDRPLAGSYKNVLLVEALLEMWEQYIGRRVPKRKYETCNCFKYYGNHIYSHN
jgi:hypothetical protein